MKTIFLSTLCFITLLCTTKAWSHSDGNPCNKAKTNPQERIYVTPEQIEVTEEGVLFYDAIEELLVLCKTLSYDNKGLYVEPAVPLRGPCGIHRQWCQYCSGCGVLYCPMKCTCSNGVGGNRP